MSEQPEQKDGIWASATPYELYVGRWSRLVAREFLGWLNLPSDLTWLDVGCGTGALSTAILELANPGAVTGIDSSTGFLASARDGIRDPRANFEIGDATALPGADNSFDTVVSALMLNHVSIPADAASEMARVVRPGGTVAAYVWDYSDGMQMMRHFWDAAIAEDPNAASKNEQSRFALCKPDPLTELFVGAGLTNVEVRPIDIPMVFRDFDDYWNPFLGGQGPAPGYAMSLDEDRRGALRDRIRNGLPTESDGSIHLTSRAWAIRGLR